MQIAIDPTLQIIPFDNKYAVKAEILVEKQSQIYFVSRTFLMFVLQIRSGMDQQSIKALKLFILDTCQDLIQRGGIDNIGFVINKKYHTIRIPNIPGIKDLLNLNVSVEDTTDIRQTILCLRNSIHAQAKKMASSKITIFMFTSNVNQSQLNFVKQSHRIKMNRHIENYQNEIKKLSNTIEKMTDQCYFYCIGYVKKFNNNKNDNYFETKQFLTSKTLDVSLLYKIGSTCTRKNHTFYFCDSFNQLKQKFKEVSAVMLYEFHSFSVMVPVNKTQKAAYTPIKMEQIEQIEQLDLEDEDIDYQDLELRIKNDREKQDQIAKQYQEQQYQQQIQYQPKLKANEDVKYVKFELTNQDQTKFTMPNYQYFDKNQINLKQIHDRGYHIFKKIDEKQTLKFPQKKKILKRMVYSPQYTSKNVNYHEPNTIQLIKCQTEYYQIQLRQIIRKAENDILQYKKRLIGTYKNTKLFQFYLQIDEVLQNQLRNRLFQIQIIVKQIYEKVFKDQLIRNEKQKRMMFELYSRIKAVIDRTNQVFSRIFKKQINNSDFNILSQAINYDKIKNSLRRKLIKRVNSNPNLINDVYDKVEQLCNQLNTTDLQAKYFIEKKQVGNCMYTYRNFATSLKQRDCLGVLFQIERPDSAIADPGRIRIRQVSTLVSGVSKFFKVHQYLLNYEFDQVQKMNKSKLQQKYDEKRKADKKQEMEQKKLPSFCSCCQYQQQQPFPQTQQQPISQTQYFKDRRIFGIVGKQYKQNWDYWNRVDTKQTFYGIMPLYVCEQNWRVAKQLMKPCMGWTACGQPLGYTYSQTQTIPFMVLSNLIRLIQQATYKIEQLKIKSQNQLKEKDQYQIRHEINVIKHNRQRHQNLLKHVEQTCKAIMRDMSGPNIDQPFNKIIVEKFINYQKPINRTVDVINNNSSFIAQIYTLIKLGMLEKPTEQRFHQFFKRLVEQQLRRQTYGWYQQEVQQKFINDLLNVKVEQMDKPIYMVLQSEYLDRFNNALKGLAVMRTEFQIHRQALQMIIKQNNKFNQTQRLTIIQYKRLYQNRVLWLWYVRFRLYQQKDRIFIHKWKCLDLMNSYQLFTMIIQNKKQRKNYRRRQAILNKQYVDPFNYYEARQYLQTQFVKMRNKKQSKNIVLLNAQKYGKASEVFANTKDLRQAAGSIMNISVGNQINFFYNQIMHGSRFVEQKLKIMLNGQHEGIVLFKYGWKMSKKRMNKLRQKYPYQFQKYQYMF